MLRIVLKIFVYVFSFILLAELFLLYNYHISVKTGRVSYLDILLDTDAVSENVVQGGELFKFILIALTFTFLVIFSSIGYLIGKPARENENSMRTEISSADTDDFFTTGDAFLHKKRKK